VSTSQASLVLVVPRVLEIPEEPILNPIEDVFVPDDL
jgi:hypothetical protein